MAGPVLGRVLRSNPWGCPPKAGAGESDRIPGPAGRSASRVRAAWPGLLGGLPSASRWQEGPGAARRCRAVSFEDSSEVGGSALRRPGPTRLM